MKIAIFFLLSLLFNSIYAQNGKILSKKTVDIKQESFWNGISENDTIKPKYEYLYNLNFFEFTYQSDTIEVKGFMIEPKADGKYPVVIFNRGGNRDFSSLSIGTLINYTSKLASQGYIIIGSNYREQDEFGGKDIDDVLNLIETTRELSKANFEKIGMFGWSRGGMMTYLALKKTEKIKTAIVGNGPTNLFDVIAERPDMETKVFAECIPNYWKNKEAEIMNRSVLFWSDELNKNSSLLILAGTNDKYVNPNQAEKIAEKLNEINYDFELLKVETDHFFSDKKSELDSIIIDWFNKKL